MYRTREQFEVSCDRTFHLIEPNGNANGDEWKGALRHLEAPDCWRVAGSTTFFASESEPPGAEFGKKSG